MLLYDVVMKNKEIKKIQFGGWSKRKFKEVRKKIRALVRKELDIPPDIKFK